MLHEIVGDRQTDPLIAALSKILLDSARTNRAHDFELLLFAVGAGEFHPVASIFTNHFGSDALIGDGVMKLKIAEHTFLICLLRHRAVKRGMPGRVVCFMAFPAIV